MNRLAIGTVQFGIPYGVSNANGKVDIAEADRILKYAKLHGIDTLDTAIAYGESETVLGRLGVDNWNVVSKLPCIPEDVLNVQAWVEQEVFATLERLRIHNLYGLLLHYPNQLTDALVGDELYSALRSLKERGYVQKIGVSVYSRNEISSLMRGREFDLIQIPLNIIDRSFVDSGYAKNLKARGIEIHVRSIFLQGLLLMGGKRPQKFDCWRSLWQQWEEWLLSNAITPLEACLRYAMSVSEIDRVVVGVESLEQLKEIVNAVDGSLPTLPNWGMPIDEDLLNPARWSLL
ncbi:aldo/keto reductase [Polynucleobacter sp. UK-Kesae-W10]|nr:aldo/keto reductase [Polynucleobacter sp. UK-Kesae-W10]